MKLPAQAAGLPPVDSLNMWPYISGQAPVSPRREVIIAARKAGGGAQGIIDESGYKMLVGSILVAAWSKKVHPLKETPWGFAAFPKVDCGGGSDPTYPYDGACLFNVVDDPEERHNIAKLQPAVVARLAKRLWDASLTEIYPHMLPAPAQFSETEACEHAQLRLSGFEGPWIDKERGSCS
ncbi:hypothetical protein JKP88DRAFT_289030 [Tribonema minus]|uniref:Uncharacterized protein n=1 Tax=Tribonema minus TaxID=303371 RepID=A0A836CHI5_9STRA|nr:hypothetical protein JKP88DRAFT_289030 [Tribonema minus]